ncbi:terminase small subunit [Erwinia rhapontici]|nr:terminase small subunit [Erwinia rhapontici]
MPGVPGIVMALNKEISHGKTGLGGHSERVPRRSRHIRNITEGVVRGAGLQLLHGPPLYQETFCAKCANNCAGESAQCAVKARSAQSKRSAKQLVANDNLTDQQRRFVAEYLKDNNATQAAVRAGYSVASAGQLGYQLLQKLSIIDAITEQQTAQMSRVLISADTVLAQMWQLATFDANDLSQYRRGCCRYCWGFGHNYQWRDMVEFEEKHVEAVERKQREPVDAGGYGYDATKPANPECPRCNGEGLGRSYIQDTRELPPIARLAYSGTKVGKNGIELASISRERMFEALAKRLGLVDTEFTQKLQQIEIEKRQLEIERLRKELQRMTMTGSQRQCR